MIKEGSVLPGGYRVKEKIGEGGWSIVYRAETEIYGGILFEYAVKVLREELRRNPELRGMFLNAGKQMQGISISNGVTVYDVGEAEGSCYLVEEYIEEGITLTRYLEKNGRLSYFEAGLMAMNICRAVEDAHEKAQIPYAYIRRESIMIGICEYVHNLGLPRLAGDAGRRLEYSAPECLAGKNFGERSEVYRMGVLLYQMLTGNTSENAKEDLHRKETYPPEVPVRMFSLILRCCREDPQRRYGSMAELEQALKNVIYAPQEILQREEYPLRPALKKAMELFGPGIVDNRKKLLNVLEDLAPQLERERALLSRDYSNEISRLLQ